MGIGDEAAETLDGQIAALHELGWNHLEARGMALPGFPKANFHDLPDVAFDLACQTLAAGKINVYCFGSTIMNWAKTVNDPFEITLAEVRRCIPRMQKLGAKYVRIMSFKPGEYENTIPPVVIERVREVTARFLGAGIQPVHENCMNYGGMGARFTLELIMQVPGLKLVFDTANPIFNADRSKTRPWPKQDPWEFWRQVKPYVAHLHVKDARWNPARNDADYTFPGEGDGAVRRILADAFASGYDAGISIEPHVAVVFHDASVKSDEGAMRQSFVRYGRQLENLIAEIRR